MHRSTLRAISLERVAVAECCNIHSCGPTPCRVVDYILDHTMSTCILIFRPIILDTNDIFFYECKVNIRILKEVISFIFYFFALFCDVSLETFFCGITGSLIQCLEKSFRKGCNLSLFMLCCKGEKKKARLVEKHSHKPAWSWPRFWSLSLPKCSLGIHNLLHYSVTDLCQQSISNQ